MSRAMRLLCSSLFILIGLGGPQTVIADGVAGSAREPIDFTLERLDGGMVSLSDYRGQWLVLNYWATWCAPCRKEMPELSALHDERNDLSVLGLAYEETEDEVFEAFIAEHDVRFPILRVDVYDPPEPFGAPKVLPTTYVLDALGRLVKAFYGPVTREAIEGAIADSPQVNSPINRP